jgi:uracil-DNA glycosylase family 4
VKPPSCTGCPYYDRTIVKGEGSLNAELFILGQSPGATEKEQGRPFVGSSGNVLGTALRRAEISRGGSYISNVVKCFVPAGESVEPEAVRKCKPLLDQEMALLPNLRTILAVGKEAFDGVTGKDIKFAHNRKQCETNYSAWLRGMPFKLGRTIVIGTLHPSFVMRSGFLNAPTFEHDVARAGDFATGVRKMPDPVYVENPTDREVGEYVDILTHKHEGGVDIETPEAAVDEDELDGVLETPIDLIGLSANPGEAIGVSPDQFRLLDRLFEGRGEKTTLWAYNGGFDYLHLGKRWSLDSINPADAMVGFHLLWPDLKTKDLATAQSYYSNVPYYKNWRKLQPQLYNTLGNCYDTFTAMEIGKACLEEGRKKKIDMSPLFWSLMPVIKAVEPWRTVGAKYDTKQSRIMLVTLMRTLDHYQKMWAQISPLYDWSSPKQLVELFTKLKIHVPKKRRPDGKYTPTTDDEALEEIIKKNPDTTGAKLGTLVQTMRTLRKATDFVDLGNNRGRLTTRAKLHGQAGGRIQCVDKSVQTIPEELAGQFPRSLVVADCEGDLILVSDFSQAEFFIYAWYTQDPKLLEIHESGDYCYGWFHEQIWKEPFFKEGCPRTKRFRLKNIPPWKLLVTKSYPLGFTYGRSAVESKYKWLYQWYHSTFTRVAPFHRELEFRANRDGYLQTVFGRLRRFPNPRGQRNEILAFPGQSTLPDILVRNAILPLKNSLPRLFGLGSRVLFTVHDSVVCNITGARKSIDKAQAALNHVTQTLQSPIPEMNGFYIRAETKIGLNWHETFAEYDLEAHWDEISGRATSSISASNAG